MKRERWTENEILALPREESDEFDRKSGRILDDPDKSLDAIGKAISAFANSGGGSLILGVEDDGGLSGVNPLRGKATIKDWLEQKIPGLLDYTLSDFRVHTVEPSDPTLIPTGRVIVVVDVGDSILAPHQSKRDKIYYHRSAGRSLAAPHFYLELLRNRITSASLKFELCGVSVVAARPWREGVSVEMKLKFMVENIGRVAAYKWAIRALSLAHPSFDDHTDAGELYQFGIINFPIKIRRMTSVVLDGTILPGVSTEHLTDFAVTLLSRSNLTEQFIAALEPLVVTYQLATETSPGEPIEVRLTPVADLRSMGSQIEALLLNPG